MEMETQVNLKNSTPPYTIHLCAFERDAHARGGGSVRDSSSDLGCGSSKHTTEAIFTKYRLSVLKHSEKYCNAHPKNKLLTTPSNCTTPIGEEKIAARLPAKNNRV